jgi:hypothetical protein
MREDADLMNNPNLYGHGCPLSAQGRGFEPELFLEETILPPETITGFGKLGLPEGLKKKVAEKDGIEAAALFEAKILALRASSSGVYAVQFEEAIEFLRRYRDEILRLSQFQNVERVNLRCVPANGESFVESSPDELMELALACGPTSLMM